MITLKDFYMGRDTQYKSDLTEEVVAHATALLPKVNQLLTHFGQDRKVNSGWRPKTVQMAVNPKAPNSKHVTGDAIDLEDKDGCLKEWCVQNQAVLAACGLWMEDPKSTPTWVHVQQLPPKSGNRIFVP